MKEATKVRITEQICRQAQLMRKGGANQLQVAELLGINGSTVSRIEAAGFDFQKYLENRRIRREKEQKRALEAQDAEEQVVRARTALAHLPWDCGFFKELADRITTRKK